MSGFLVAMYVLEDPLLDGKSGRLIETRDQRDKERTCNSCEVPNKGAGHVDSLPTWGSRLFWYVEDIHRRLTDKSNKMCTYMGCRVTTHPINNLGGRGMRIGP